MPRTAVKPMSRSRLQIRAAIGHANYYRPWPAKGRWRKRFMQPLTRSQIALMYWWRVAQGRMEAK